MIKITTYKEWDVLRRPDNKIEIIYEKFGNRLLFSCITDALNAIDKYWDLIHKYRKLFNLEVWYE